MKADGLSTRDVARRLGLSEKAVRKQLRRLGWKAPKVEQLTLRLALAGADPNVAASAVAAPGSVDEPHTTQTRSPWWTAPALPLRVRTQT